MLQAVTEDAGKHESAMLAQGLRRLTDDCSTKERIE